VSGCGGTDWPTLIVAIVSAAVSVGVIILAIETLGSARDTAAAANEQLNIARVEHKAVMAQLAARSDLRVTLDDTFDPVALVGQGHYRWTVTVTIDNAHGRKAARDVDVHIRAPVVAAMNPLTPPGAFIALPLVDDPELGGQASEYLIRLSVVTRSSPSRLTVAFTATSLPDIPESVVRFRVRVSCDDQPDDALEVPAGRDWPVRWRAG